MKDSIVNDTEREEVCCPYCGKITGIHIDGLGEVEDFIEECDTCCRPMNIHVDWDDNGSPVISTTKDFD